jgi:predicted  nucleic acid-binding Zn-ribbon protein
MAISKTSRVIYAAKKFVTGLTDVTANIRREGVSAATGVSLLEISNGEYELILTPTLLNGYGGAGFYDFYINSASEDAPAIASKYITENDNDDIIAQLTTVEGKIDTLDGKIDVIDSEVGAIQTDVTSIKVTVEDTNDEVKDVSHGLSPLKTLIDAIQDSVDNISNVTRFSAPVPGYLIRPGSGNKRYKIPVRLYDLNGNPEDPDSNQIQLLIKDESGTSRDSYIVGFTTQPHYINRTGIGIYDFELDIPSTAELEQLLFEFKYLEDTVAFSQVAVSEVVREVQTSGLALETTAQAILTDTDDMQPRIGDIQTKINSATFGLSALKDLIDIVDTNVDGIASELANATYGLSALKDLIDGKASQVSVNTANTHLTDVKGVGWDSDDSLKKISDRVYNGGVAV